MGPLFGDTPTGIILLDIILIIFAGILIPILWKIHSSMTTHTNQSKSVIDQLGSIFREIREMSKELVEARISDSHIRNELDNIRSELHEARQEFRDRLNQLEKYK